MKRENIFCICYLNFEMTHLPVCHTSFIRVMVSVSKNLEAGGNSRYIFRCSRFHCFHISVNTQYICCNISTYSTYFHDLLSIFIAVNINTIAINVCFCCIMMKQKIWWTVVVDEWWYKYWSRNTNTFLSNMGLKLYLVSLLLANAARYRYGQK